MQGRHSISGVLLDDLPDGLIGRLVTLPADLYLRNAGNLVLYAPAGADAALLRRPDLAGRFWIAESDVQVIRATLPDAMASLLAERDIEDPVATYREAYRLLQETLEPVFARGAQPDADDIRLVESVLDITVDQYLQVATTPEAALAAVRRRHEWIYDALNTTLLSVFLGAVVGLEAADLRTVARGAFFHDLGVVALPLELTEHPGPLDQRQLARVRLHPSIGVRMLTQALGAEPDYAVIVRDHHERLDGSGYPNATTGDEIGIFARIVAIADTWEAMTARRPHRAPADFAAAEQWLLRASSGYDPRLADAFIRTVAR